MKIITLQQLIDDFENIIDDVGDNGQHYQIESDQGNLMLIPANEFDVLKDVYEDWIEDTQVNPDSLPIMS